MTLRQLLLCVLILTNSSAGLSALTSTAPRHTAWVRLDQHAADQRGFDNYLWRVLPKPVQDKNFYLLSLFQRRSEVRKLIAKNPILNQIAREKLLALKKAESCNDVNCFYELLHLDPTTIETAATELQKLESSQELKDGLAFMLLVKKEMRPSGFFIKYNQQSDAQMLTSAWKDAASGLNRILSVYGLGKDPRYKAIDKVSFDVSSEEYVKLTRMKVREISRSNDALFFEPTLNFALKLLEINRRDEAGRYEPLELGENKEAVRNLKNIRWNDYRYSFILVLGSGAQDLSTRLSPIGAQRTDVAAQLFLQKKAPLLILSGGHVHPMQTPYCEAIEMKKYAMEKYKIPETSILIEPHARHTTTNFRNGARLAFRYGIPTTMALVTSSESHITSSTGEEFRKRCVNELGYFPVEFIKQISPVEAEFKPSVASLFFDANDPLDP